MSRPLQVGDINISGNVVETTVSNSNLDLRANGSGQVLLQENVDIQNNLTVRNFNVDSISVANSVDLEIIDLSTDIQFEDNVITTTNSNSNLELRTAGTGSVYLQNVEVTQSSISTRANIDSTTSSITIAPTENLIVNSTTSLLTSNRNNSTTNCCTRHVFRWRRSNKQCKHIKWRSCQYCIWCK